MVIFAEIWRLLLSLSTAPQ